MADWPAQGVSPWDDALKAYIDDLVDEAVLGSGIGAELGYASRVSNFTTVAVASTDAANATIPSFSLSVVGQGRPVELGLRLPSVYHSVANTNVNATFVIDGNPASTSGSLGGASSPSTSVGSTLVIGRRTPPLTIGQTYTITARVWGQAAGTATCLGGAFYPIEMWAVGR